ncbi:MAG TPA: Crp/Fnr family transcriptional regulator [Terriglobales bacterium]|nr:Crp/Fnr family transcriptional regulator [Terriglobales bacterium]
MMTKEKTAPVEARMDLEGNAVANRILCAISADEFRKLQPILEFVRLNQHRSLHNRAKSLNAAYFINSGVASLIVAGNKGRSVEVGVVGCEGLTGTGLIAGLRRATVSALMQIEGSAFRIERDAFEAAVKSSPELRERVLRYSMIQTMQIAQTAACNRLHDARQRLARWLLMARDRISSNVVKLTHEFLAVMLGTDRPTVTIAASYLQKAGAIQYGRKALTIVNRKLLEGATCECYFAVKRYNPAVGL